MAILQSLQSVPNSVVGGNLIAILLRQAILRRKPRPRLRLQDVQIAETTNPLIYLFAAIPVNARTQESYVYSATPTKHAVEDGTIYSDHVILDPVQVDLDFEISNIDPNQARQSFDLLEQVWKQREPIELLTEHKKLKNMVLASFRPTNSAPNWGGLVCRATFKQINTVVLKTIKIKDEQVKYPTEIEGQTVPGGPNVSQSAKEVKNKGLTSPQATTQSTARQLFQRIF